VRVFKLGKVVLLCLMIMGFGQLQVRPVWACSCLPVTPSDALEAADAVFAGVATEIEMPSGTVISSDDPVQVQFRVQQRWKGSQVQRLTVTTALDSAACGYTFQADQRYLVFAHSVDGQLTTGLCSGTQPLAQATEALAFLNEASAQATPTPTPAPDLADMDVQTWSSYSPDSAWVAERTVALSQPGGEQHYTQLIVRRVNQTIGWTVIDAWQPFGLGYTVPEPLRWSGDGQSLYFTNRPVVDGCAPFVDGADLQWVDLRDGSVTELLPPVTLVLALSPDEQTLAYRSRDGADLILLDLNSGEQHTFPVTVREQDQWGAIVWRPDSGALALTIQHNACHAPGDPGHSIVQVDVNANTQTTLLDHDARRLTTVAWPASELLTLADPQGQRWFYSPQSQELTPQAADSSGAPAVGPWRMAHSAGSNSLQLATTADQHGYTLNFTGVVDQVAWSPDGQRLVVVETNRIFDDQGQPLPPQQPTRLWQVTLTDETVSAPTLVFSASTEDQEGIVLGSWSPNARYLLFWTDPYFSASVLADGTPLWILDTERGQANLITGQPPLGEDSALLTPRYQSWAPDSSALVVTAGNYRSAQINKWLLRYEPATQQATVLISKTEQLPGIVAWSPDGKLIAYAAVPAAETSPETADLTSFENPAIAGRRIYLLNPKTGAHWQLNDTEIFQDAPRWSEDGLTLFFVQRADDTAIVMATNTATGETHPVPDVQQPLADIPSYYGQFEWDALLAQAEAGQ
jgi:Tol biopolymer transport system component